MPLSEYLLGFGLLLLTLGGAAAAAALVTVRRLGHLAGTVRGLAWALVTTATIVLAHLAPLVIGVLSRWTVLGATVLLVAGAAVLPRVRPPAAPDDFPAAPASPALARWAAAALWLLVAAWVVAWLRPRATTPIDGTDMLTFDLPIMGTWIQEGGVWQVTDFQPLQPHGAYPHNGDLAVLSTILPWKSDVLVRFTAVPFLAMLGAAIYALARELGAPVAAALAAGAAALTLPIVLSTTLYQGLPDAILWATFATGVLFLARSRRIVRRPDVVLAGLGLGLAFGTKWYGPPAVAVVLLVWAAGLLLARRPLRWVVRHGLVVVAIVTAAGGFWLVRNAIEYGSPVFPSAVGPLGFDTPYDPLRARLDHKVAEYLTDADALRDYIWPALRERFGLGGLLVPLGLLAAAVALVRRRRQFGGIVATGVAGALIIVVYTLLPYSALGPEGTPVDVGANTRYALPGVFLAIVTFAAAAGRSRIGELALVGLASLAVLDGLRRSPLDPGGGRVVLWTLLIAAAAAAAAGAWRRRGALAARRPLAAAAAVALLVAVAAAGYRGQRSFHDNRYRDDPTFLYVTDHVPEDARIGTAGRWALDGPPPTWPMYGPRVGNEVRHIGRTRDGQMREYEAFEDWRRAASGFQLVLVGRLSGPETGWAARAGFRPVAESPRFRLYATGG
jgi:hypothetical protein